MKLHDILKDFNGSQTGHDFRQFKAGSTVALSDSLAAIAVKEGWVKPHEPGVIKGSKPKMEADPHAPDELVEATDLAETRETKVDGPEETKPTAPAAKKGKK